FIGPSPVLEDPTAMHAVALVHDTSRNRLSSAPAGVGVETSDQLVPSQWATSVSGASTGGFPPTAAQTGAVAQVTPFSSDAVGAESGAGKIDQLVPSQCSMRLW